MCTATFFAAFAFYVGSKVAPVALAGINTINTVANIARPVHQPFTNAIVAQDRLTAYTWKPNIRFPSHGDLVDPSQLLQTLVGQAFGDNCNTTSRGAHVLPAPSSVMGIDEVHLRGYLHLGVWVFIVDSQHRLLLIKRGSTITCPHSWSLLGEHSGVGEETQPRQTVLRGLQEELGLVAPETWLRRNWNLMADVSLPLYYYRDFGPSLEGRVDRQFTYLWYAEFNETGERMLEEIQRNAIHSKNEDEVSQMKWVAFSQLEHWMQETPQDFCSDQPESILPFFQIGLKHLKRQLQNLD